MDALVLTFIIRHTLNQPSPQPMQILIGCAKTMTPAPGHGVTLHSEPAFRHIAHEIAMQMSTYTPLELQAMLKVNPAIARETWQRYHDFHDPATRIPAAWAYDGMVFKKLAPETLSTHDLAYANSHLFISSFLYGLLRPLDLINPYRLEGNIEPAGNRSRATVQILAQPAHRFYHQRHQRRRRHPGKSREQRVQGLV